MRALGIRIGSGTGYTREMMADILPRAAEQGYAPEIVVCAGETPSGRPAPLMIWKALIEMDAWPARACIKVDDAPVGIEEGKLPVAGRLVFPRLATRSDSISRAIGRALAERAQQSGSPWPRQP